jgi:hypothetical protein
VESRDFMRLTQIRGCGDFWRGFNTGGIQSLISAAKAGDGKNAGCFMSENLGPCSYENWKAALSDKGSHGGYEALGHYYPTNCPITPQPTSANSTTCRHRML